MKECSTEYPRIEQYHLINKAMNGNKSIRFVFNNVSKAFDKVWCKGIIYKFEYVRIQRQLLKWFDYNLVNRIQ